MVQQIHHQGSGEDESRRRDQRARRKPADAAYPVTAGASAAQARTESDQQTGDSRQWEGANEAELERTRSNSLSSNPPASKPARKQTCQSVSPLTGLRTPARIPLIPAI